MAALRPVWVQCLARSGIKLCPVRGANDWKHYTNHLRLFSLSSIGRAGWVHCRGCLLPLSYSRLCGAPCVVATPATFRRGTENLAQNHSLASAEWNAKTGEWFFCNVFEWTTSFDECISSNHVHLMSSHLPVAVFVYFMIVCKLYLTNKLFCCKFFKCSIKCLLIWIISSRIRVLEKFCAAPFGELLFAGGARFLKKDILT